MTVQRYPAGLLELLAAKTTGRNPQDIAPTVQSVVDLLQFYAMAEETYQEVNATVAEGAGTTITVPEQEYWILNDLSLAFVKTATATYVAGSLWQRKGSTGPFVGLASGPVQYGMPFGSTAAPFVYLCSFNPAVPRLLAPGTVIYGTCDVLGTDATVDIRLQARYGVLH